MEDTQGIFHADPENFNGDYHNLVIEQYKMYVGTLSDSSDSRRTFHTLFISISTLVFAGMAFVGGNGEPTVYVSKDLLLFANAVGIVMSLAWWGIIKNYRERNKVILGIISEIEDELPLRLFRSEYERAGCGSSKFTYLVHSTELWIPWFFATVHLSLGLGIFLGFFKLGVA